MRFYPLKNQLLKEVGQYPEDPLIVPILGWLKGAGLFFSVLHAPSLVQIPQNDDRGSRIQPVPCPRILRPDLAAAYPVS